MDEEKTVGARFTVERKRLGFGVQQAADVFGITRNAINKIERGSMPSGAVLRELSAAGGDVSYVLTGARSRAIDLDMLGLCEAALRLEYERARPDRQVGAVRARMSALVYNSAAGALRADADVNAALRDAAARIVESLNDPSDDGMLERNLFVQVLAPEVARHESIGVVVQGNQNRVAGRDMIKGDRKPKV